MKKFTRYSIDKESFDDMCKSRRFNPCLEITFKDRTGQHIHKISAGYSDEIHVYRDHGIIFILSRNMSLGYVGIEAFNCNEKIGDIFLEAHQVNETLGREDLAPITIIRRLKEHIIV